MVAKSVTGDTPTRCLSSSNIDQNDPAAYLACLSFDNKPLEALRQDSLILQQMSMSFIGVVPEYVYLEWIKMTELHTVMHAVKNKCLLIVSGTLESWKRTLLRGSTNGVSVEVRIMCNKAYDVFSGSRLIELFINYERVYLPDETFILKGRR
jgi:hypothetical protein